MQTKVLEYQLPIKVTSQKGGGFVITCPIWNDCYAQGDTIDEAILEITAVAQTLIEFNNEENKKMPLKPQKKKGLDNLSQVPVIVSA